MLMGSGAEVAHETVEWLLARGEKVGVLKVRLYRPFAAEVFLKALPRTVKALAAMRPHQGARRPRRSRCTSTWPWPFRKRRQESRAP